MTRNIYRIKEKSYYIMIVLIKINPTKIEPAYKLMLEFEDLLHRVILVLVFEK